MTTDKQVIAAFQATIAALQSTIAKQAAQIVSIYYIGYYCLMSLLLLQTESENQFLIVVLATTGHKTEGSYAAECTSTPMQKGQQRALCYRSYAIGEMIQLASFAQNISTITNDILIAIHYFKTTCKQVAHQKKLYTSQLSLSYNNEDKLYMFTLKYKQFGKNKA